MYGSTRWPYRFRGISLVVFDAVGFGVGGGEVTCGGVDIAVDAHELAIGFMEELVVDADGVRAAPGWYGD